MDWRGQRESDNVEDRRGMSTGTKIVGGGIGTLLLAAVVYFLGGDPSALLQQQSSHSFQTDNNQYQISTEASDSLGHFSKVTLASTEDVWRKILTQNNIKYQDPVLVLFNGQTNSQCGGANSSTGPFYCPADEKVYLDLSFFSEMHERFGAKGQFADAYIIAHEVGHHIQNLMGLSEKVHQLEEQSRSEAEANRWSVKLELNADFLAGVWAHYAQNLKINEADIQSALSAASAVGDDRLQEISQGYVVPDAFTHGTSKERMYWFMKGYTTGDLDQGDTFSDPNL